MKTVSVPICDGCNLMILDEKGFIIQGNIYIANPSKMGGLVGGGDDKRMSTPLQDIDKICLCTTCTLNALGLKRSVNRTSTRGSETDGECDNDDDD